MSREDTFREPHSESLDGDDANKQRINSMGNQVNRRSFLRKSALMSAAAGGAAVGGAVSMSPVIGRTEEPTRTGTSPTSLRSLTPKLMLKGTAALSKPLLAPSQLSHRIGLARTRAASYPLDRMDFIMIDLERPDRCSRHATQCYGDLTGRLLEFLSCSEGVDGRHDARLDGLFERILKQRRPSGIIGRHPMVPDDNGIQDPCAQRLSCGLMRYYELTGNARALEAAVGLGNRLWKVRDNWRKFLKDCQGRSIVAWVSEFLAQLYAATNEPRWMEFCGMIRDHLGSCDQGCHAHGFMSTLRGLQQMAIVTGDLAWNEKAEKNRRLIIERHYETPDGGVPEGFPRNGRNEGCAIADWMILNLNAGLLGAPDAYERAERIFWNALSFNQLITGCFGQRPLTGNGYGIHGMEEAWWCCVHEAGMAMSEYARHAVTFRQGAVHVNLLAPGQFESPLPGGKWAKVKITTAWPSRAEAVIEAEDLPDGVPLKLRVPSCVRKADVKESRVEGKARITLQGELGHRIEHCDPGVIVMYGPLVLVPATGLSQQASLPNQAEAGIPPGYIPRMLHAGVPTIKLQDKPDAAGFVKLPLCPPDRPLPEWSYFDEGPGSPTWVEGSAVEVQLKFPNGKVDGARFTPMCYSTSALMLFDTPVVFRGIE